MAWLKENLCGYQRQGWEGAGVDEGGQGYKFSVTKRKKYEGC